MEFEKNIKCILGVLLFIILIVHFMKSNKENFRGKKKSFSQFEQDLKVLKHFNNKKKGYFIEIGALDGIYLSNTYLLEKDYKWKGICIEPVPSEFKKLKKNRKSVNIPQAVYNVNDKVVNIVDAGSSGHSGIRNDIDTHKHILKNEDIKVKTKTLTRIMDENNSPKFIEYLSIDTEGSELKILEGIDFNKYSFGYINIEHNHQEPRRTQMRNLLLKNGYRYMGEDNVDDIYIKE